MSDQHSAGEQEIRTLAIEKILKFCPYTELVAKARAELAALTAATADAKLAGELAGRPLVEAAKNLLEACYQADAREELPHEFTGELIDAMRNALLNLPLTPDSAGVLERIKRAERARAYRRCAEIASRDAEEGEMALCNMFEQWAEAEQAAIADGAQK